MAINIKKIDLSQFMLNEEDEMMMEKMDKKSLPDEDIKLFCSDNLFPYVSENQPFLK